MESPDEWRKRINDAKQESADISQQIGFDARSLFVRPSALEPWRKFSEALREDDRKEKPERRCAGKPEKYSDYEKPVSVAKAMMYCAGCPLFDLCDEFGQAERPAWGIHGGKVYGRENVEVEDE